MPTGPAPGPGVAVRVTSEQPNLHPHEPLGSVYGTVSTFTHVASVRTDAFRPICALPCTLTLAPGGLMFALSHGGGQPARAPAVQIPGGGELRAHLDDRSGLRAAGIAIRVAGGIVGGGGAAAVVLLGALNTSWAWASSRRRSS